MEKSNLATFYVVRHGETGWNLVGRQQGHLDSPLTAKGIQQAKALAEALTDKGVGVIYSSILGRALKTAEIIGACLGLPVQTDIRLKERNLGILQGLTIDEFRRQYSDEAYTLLSRDPDYILPEGESFRHVHDRVAACLEELAQRHSGQKILVVAHSGILRCLFYKAVGLPLSTTRRFSLFNGSINRFTITGGEWFLDTWGDISHMEGMSVLDDD